jgi:hypothetical protein
MALPISGTVNDNQAGILRPRKTATPLIINGDMAIWQRGTALSSNSGNYACDRFWYAGTGMTSQRSTDVPSGFIYSNKLTYGSADMAIGQPIELPATGKQGSLISGQTVTIAFYGKVDSGTDGVSTAINFRNGKFDSTDQQAFTISDNSVTLTTSWQRFTKTFTIPTVHANNIMTAFEINGISKTAYITGVQAEIGTFDTNSIPDFQFEDRGTSLARCQRYYIKIGGSPNDDNVFGSGFAHSTTSTRFVTHFPVSLRAPATAIETTGTASDYRVLGGGASAKNMNGLPTFASCGLTSARTSGAVSSGLSQYSGLIVDTGTNNNTFLAWDAEL